MTRLPLVLLASCSFFMDQPRDRSSPSCDPSRTLPIVDLVVGGTIVAASAGLYIALETRAPNATDADEVRGISILGAVVGATYLFAGARGMVRTRQCREAQARRDLGLR